MRWEEEENHREDRSTSQGERKVGQCWVTEPSLGKEGGVHRTGATERSVRGQKCPLDCQDRRCS